MGEIFMGVLPFVIGELIVIALLIAFPEIALWLPGKMR
jgi:TRAP-type mannitol/chloroaromatic compound transport system permease large subunit